VLPTLMTLEVAPCPGLVAAPFFNKARKAKIIAVGAVTFAV